MFESSVWTPLYEVALTTARLMDGWVEERTTSEGIEYRACWEIFLGGVL